MNSSLIIDAGMHAGRDTGFYLKKGFDVVAVEANPELVKKAQSTFKDALSDGRLVIHDVAIADHEGEIEFFVNDQHDDWGTTSQQFALRNEGFGTANTLTRVKCTTFQDILRQHDIPYYLKIDIEGADILCLAARSGKRLREHGCPLKTRFLNTGSYWPNRNTLGLPENYTRC